MDRASSAGAMAEELCFDCGLPVFGPVVSRTGISSEHPKAIALGVSTGVSYIGGRAWHLECLAARRPARDKLPAARPLLFTMRMAPEERVMLNELARALDFPDVAELIRWLARAEKLQRERIREVNRQRAITTPGVPAPGEGRADGRSRRPRGAARAR